MVHFAKAGYRFIAAGLPEKYIGRLAWMASSILIIYVAWCDPGALSARAETAAEALAQQLFGSSYPTRAAGRIIILESTQEGYRDNKLGLGNPLTYRELAVLIKKAMENHARGVFLDYQFIDDPQGESAEGLPLLVDAINQARRAGMPVYSGPVRHIPALMPLAAAVRGVNVMRKVEHAADYNLQAPENSQLSAAGALYLAVCEKARDTLCDSSLTRRLLAAEHGGPRLDPVAMRFGTGAGVAEFDQEDPDCASPNFAARLNGMLADATPKPSCGQQRMEPVHLLLVKPPAEAQALLHGRIVLIGPGLGQGDDHTVPAVGNLPGVELHAMALDNMLVWGNRYPHWPADWIPNSKIGPDEIQQLIVLLVIPILIKASARHRHARFRGPEARVGNAKWVVHIITGLVMGLIALTVVWLWLFGWPAGAMLLTLTLTIAVVSLISSEELGTYLAPLDTLKTMWIIGASLAGIAFMLGLRWPAYALVAGLWMSSIIPIRRRHRERGAKGAKEAAGPSLPPPAACLTTQPEGAAT